MQRSQQLAAMFLLGAFVVGGSLGFTVDRVMTTRAAQAAPVPKPFLDEFAEKLSLTPAQRSAVDSILDERHRIVDSLMAPIRPGLDSARQSARRQIAARLDAAQKVKFQQYLADMAKKDSIAKATGR